MGWGVGSGVVGGEGGPAHRELSFGGHLSGAPAGLPRSSPRESRVGCGVWACTRANMCRTGNSLHLTYRRFFFLRNKTPLEKGEEVGGSRARERAHG